MASLTTMVSDLSRRVGALENTVNDESDIIPLISKLYTTVTCHPVYCADTLACSTTLACDEDASGTVLSLAEILTHIGIGIGAAPSSGTTLLPSEVTRKGIVDPVAVDDILLLSVSWDNTEANGYTYTNAGVFMYGTDTIDTGTLYFGGAINQVKDSTKSLTIGIEITAVEVQ